jgi:hypothetical protein
MELIGSFAIGAAPPGKRTDPTRLLYAKPPILKCQLSQSEAVEPHSKATVAVIPSAQNVEASPHVRIQREKTFIRDGIECL